MSNKYVRCTRGMYERRIIAIMLSALITIVVQTTLLFPSYQTDATLDESQAEEVIEINKKPSFIQNLVKTQALQTKNIVNDAIRLMSVSTETTTTTTTSTTTTSTTSETTTTTTTTSTTSETTTTTTTTVEPTTAEEVFITEAEPTEEVQVEDVIEEDVPSEDEPADVPEEVVSEEEPQELPISESDFILLCNCVALEYGADWISVPEKALVVEVVMNRVNHSAYPNTIYGVISAPYQFSGSSSYLNLNTYSNRVTESVKEAVRYYFDHPEEFQHGYYGFWGDGHRNYFR